VDRTHTTGAGDSGRSLLSSRNFLIFLIVTVVGVLADQLTKAWVVANVAVHRDEISLIPGFLSIVHAQNPGAALSLLHDFAYRHVVFGVFTLVAVFVIADMFRKLRPNEWFMAGTLGLVLSGAVGNAIDRVRQQYVTDFIRVYTEQPTLHDWLMDTFGTAEWPTFNVADISLVVGVVFFALYQLREGRRATTEAPADVGSA